MGRMEQIRQRLIEVKMTWDRKRWKRFELYLVVGFGKVIVHRIAQADCHVRSDKVDLVCQVRFL